VLSRAVFVSLAPLFLLSVHLVTVLPWHPSEGRAVVSEHLLVQSAASEAARPLVAAPQTSAEKPNAEKPNAQLVVPGTTDAGAPPARVPVHAVERDGRVPARRGRPREWLVLRVIAEEQAARRKAPGK
jgi:hypothetical protein